MEKRKFTAKIDGKDVALLVVEPSAEAYKEAHKVYTNSFNEAIRNGSIVRARMDGLLEQQGLWNEEQQIKFDTLQKQILDAEIALDKGGIPLSRAKEIAVEMKKNRAELRELISVKTELDSHTAEGQAETQRFNYYVSACTIREDNNKRVFSSYDDYLESSSKEVAVLAARTLANMLYGLEEDYESKLPENEFLYKYKFVNKDLKFIDKQGRLTDSEGRLVDASGRYVDEEGNYIDKYGNPIDADGNYDVKFTPFTDDEGNPVVLDEEQEEPSETQVKSKRKPKAKQKNSEPEA
jgi:hypothetical protein